MKKSIATIMILLLLGCTRSTKSNFSETNDEAIIVNESSYNNIENVEINENIIYHDNVTDYLYNEILNNNNLSFHRDDYEIKSIFGEPLSINETEVDFWMSGGIVTKIQELVFEDFTHIYYLYEDGTIFYMGFIIEKYLDRLKTINIGDTEEKLLSTFNDRHYLTDENIIFYTEPVTAEIQFIINNSIIEGIYVSFYLL